MGLGHTSRRYSPEKVDLDNVLSVSCGRHHTIVLTDRGQIYVCGHNDHGQLGLGDEDDRRSFQKLEFKF